MHARLRTISVVGLALVATACTAAAPSPSPTAAPTVPASPTATPLPSPTEKPPCSDATAAAAPECLPPTDSPAPATPTPTVAPTPSPTVESTPGATAGEIDHPTEPSAVVLQVEQTGGFTMQGYQYARRAPFTLYGDGRIVYRVGGEEGPIGNGFPALQEARMNEEQVQALIRFALGPGPPPEREAALPESMPARVTSPRASSSSRPASSARRSRSRRWAPRSPALTPPTLPR